MPIDLLERFTLAKANIDKGWCQWTTAVTPDGRSCSIEDPEVARVCLTGAFAKDFYRSRYREMNAAFAVLAEIVIANWPDRIPPRIMENKMLLTRDILIVFNDNRNTTKEDIQKLLDIALEQIKQQQ